MFGRDNGLGVPVVAVATDGAEGKEKRVELLVGESTSAEEEERTEKRDGGCADMTEMRTPEWDRRGGGVLSETVLVSRFAFAFTAWAEHPPLDIISEEVSRRPENPSSS